MRTCLVSPLDRRGPWRTPENGVGSWPLALGGDLFPIHADDWSPLEVYDVLLLHVAMDLYERLAELLARFAHKTTVLMITCDAMYIDPQGFFPGWRIPLKRLLDRASLAVCETEETGFFQAMTATPVVHLPLPVPLAALRTLATEARAAPEPPAPPRVWLGAAFRPKKNGIATALAFRRLRERVSPPPQALVFADEPEAEREAYAAWGIHGVEVRPACDQPSLWRQVARCRLALHLDYRRTVGRFSADCAALGIPCVSTAGATMQRACFPDLVAEPWDVDGATATAARLLRHPLFREQVVARAAEALAPYDLAPMALRLREHISRTAARASTEERFRVPGCGFRG